MIGDHMGNFRFIETEMQGLLIIEPRIFEDERGYFMETYHHNAFKEVGLNQAFVQDNQSKSKKGVLRGLHFQRKHPQGKLVRVIGGKVFDVAVDLRKNSPTFREWRGIILSGENQKQFYIPEGFAHGFLVLSEEAVVSYKCTDFYDPKDQQGIKWDDPILEIEWPVKKIDQIIVSDKDRMLKSFKEIKPFLF